MVGLEGLVWFRAVTCEGGVGIDVGSDTSHVFPVSAWVAVTIDLVDPIAESAKNLPSAPTLHKPAEPRLITLIETDAGVGAAVV